MYIQKVKVIGEDELDVKYVNIPLDNGEKIISNEPYVSDMINKYRMSMGGDDLNNIYTFENASKDSLIDNVIVTKNDDKFNIKINNKYDCSIPINKEPSSVIESFDEGVSYNVPILATNRKNGINVSIKDSIKMSIKNELLNSVNNKNSTTAYTAHIDECINGGYYVSIQGVRCFMPGSCVSLYRLSDFESVLGTDMMVIPIMYNSKRDIVVVSHVDFLEKIKPTVLNTVMNDDRNTKYKGIVTLKKHDYILVTFNECLAGKLSYSDMDDDTKELFINNKIEIEKTEIDFYIDMEQNGQLLLTQNWKTKEIWNDKISKEFSVNMEFDGIIVGATKKFILVKIKYNVIGILPLKQTYNINDHIKVKITMIDVTNRKIKLALC